MGKNVGAIMADATVAAGIAAGTNNISRSSGASGTQRVSPLRPVSAVAPTPQAFTQNLAFVQTTEQEQSPASVAQAPEPGASRLSSTVQLILAETREQEEQSTFVDRSVLDQATSSYAQSQESVRETIGLARIAAANANTAPAGDNSTVS